jgi:GrpB-like predicted nucleotidyltransferase (UPF0157 family)
MTAAEAGTPPDPAAKTGEPPSSTVQLVPYDPEWPGRFDRIAALVRGALRDRFLVLEHVGSTAVPGLAAKPVIDLLLVVPNSADEPAYLPALQAAGFALVLREPAWYEHRLLRPPSTVGNVHILSPGCPEIDRMLLFRDWLRVSDPDRRLYEATKRALAEQPWATVQAYADAKTEVVHAILARASAARSSR